MPISNDIVSSLGVGSGINSNSIVEQLVEIEKAPGQDRIDSKREAFEAQVSDYGLMRSALADLQDAVDLLTDKESFAGKSATFNDSDFLIPSQLDDNAPVGNYTFTDVTLAKAQSLASGAAFNDPSDAVGKGTVTFSFGAWNDALTPPEVFVADTEQDTFTITIDDSNNSLTGLRDAINEADRGVQASILNTGNGFELVLTSVSGASNELKIDVVEEGGGPTNTDANDLSRFAFTEGAAGANQQMAQNQSGGDAMLTVNGLEITRSSNVIDDVVEGFEFTLVKDSTDSMTVNVFDDKEAAEANVRGFIDAYNTFLEALEPIVGFNEETEEDGSLKRDATAKGVIRGLRSNIVDAIPGLSGGFTSLAAVGVRTANDGSLYIDDTELASTGKSAFETAFEDNFDLVKALFTPDVSSSSSDVEVNSFSGVSVPGSYAVVVTQDPVKGGLTGVAAAGTLLADIAAAGATDYDFTISVDGTTSGSISLTPGTYTNDSLAAHIQSQINNDSALAAVSANVQVIWDTDHFEITSNRYGSKSSVSVTDGVGSSADLGLALGASTAGINVAGTFDGVAGFGVGQVLLPALNTDPSGLSLVIQPGATTATIDFSGGFGREMSQFIEQYLQTSGIFDDREDILVGKLGGLDDDQEKLDRHIESFQTRLSAQFLLMERIVASLNSSGGFLDGILDRLPFTASRN